MIHIFDLDDTLYDERSFVEGGFQYVAEKGETLFNWKKNDAFLYMMKYFSIYGRQRIFDSILDHYQIKNKKNINTCVYLYRYHPPFIRMSSGAKRTIAYLSKAKKYIVTDGHKIVQERKIEALGIKNFFNHVYITHRYGIINAKPSIYCFNLIKKREKCSWRSMIYVGDNPMKDFINLRKVGVHTVRVHTGMYKDMKVEQMYDADYHISCISEYSELVKTLWNRDL